MAQVDTKRIFDDPNHPQYGPVRRMWVILAGLDMLGRMDEFYPVWENSLSQLIKDGIKETAAKRFILGMYFQKLSSD